MALSFFNLRKECYNFNFGITSEILADAYELSIIMETSEIYRTFLKIDGVSMDFVTLENPFVLFCKPFDYGDANLDFQIPIKNSSHSFKIPRNKYRRAIEKFLNLGDTPQCKNLDPEIIKLKDYEIYEQIENGVITFNEISINDIDFIKRTRLDKLTDRNGQNILFCTAEDPELTIEVIRVFGVKFEIDGTGEDAFNSLAKEILERYYDLGLHKITNRLPVNFLRSDQEDASRRFEEKDVDLFIENPKLLRFLRFEDFRDGSFFDQVCFLSDEMYYGGKYALDVAIYYGHLSKIKQIKIYPNFNLYQCEYWNLLDDDLIFHFLG